MEFLQSIGLAVIGAIVSAFVSWLLNGPVKKKADKVINKPRLVVAGVWTIIVIIWIAGGAWVGRFIWAPLAMHWNTASSTALDFENASDADGWNVMERKSDDSLQLASDASLAIVQDSFFDGSSSLQVRRKISISPKDESQFWIVWNTNDKHGSPDLLIGHIFLQNNPAMSIDWSQVCVEVNNYGWSECIGFKLEPGKWNRFAVDLRHIEFINIATHQIQHIGTDGNILKSVIIQGGIGGDQKTDTEYVFNIDDLELYYVSVRPKN